jgi:hypothetical protein
MTVWWWWFYLVNMSKREERKLPKNNKREKIIGYHDTDNKSGQTLYQQVSFNKESLMVVIFPYKHV